MTFEEIMNYVPGRFGNQAKFNELVNAYSQNPYFIIPFVGAGMTADLGYPTWNELLKILTSAIYDTKDRKEVIKLLKQKEDNEQVASCIERILEGTFYDNVRRIFSLDGKRTDYKDLAVDILPLLFNQIVTTNYDHVIEECYAKHKKNINVITLHNTFSFYSSLADGEKYSLYKLHGDYESNREEIIFTKESYDRYYGDPESELCEKLKSFIHSRRLLFLGASLKQDRLAKFLIEVTRDGDSHFAIMPCKKREIGTELKRLKANGIKDAILYPDEDHRCVTVILESLLREVKPEEYCKKFECNDLLPSAIYSINGAREIKGESFIRPNFLMRDETYRGGEGRKIDGLVKLYKSIHTQKANSFFLIDGRLEFDEGGDGGLKALHGGGMGKSTVLSKIYIDNRVKSLLFIMKDYKVNNGWGRQIVDKCRSGQENWILFDGINEMSEKDFKDFNDELKEILVNDEIMNYFREKKIKFVFSARNIDICENLYEYLFHRCEKRVYEICYRKKEFEKYFANNQIELTHDIKRILHTPLLAALYVKTKKTLNNIIGDRNPNRISDIIFQEPLCNQGEVLYNYVYIQKYKYIEQNTRTEIEKVIEEELPRLASILRVQNRQSIPLDEYCSMIEMDNYGIENIRRNLGIAAQKLDLVVFDYSNNLIGEMISFVHEEFLDFFAALYMKIQVDECIKLNLLYSPGLKNPTANVHRYFIEMQDGKRLQSYLDQMSMSGCGEHMGGCATAAVCLGDLYYYKSEKEYKSRYTDNEENKIDMLKKARQYYVIQKEMGDPLGDWNIAQADRAICKLLAGQEREEIEKEIYKCAKGSLENEEALRKTLQKNGTSYYDEMNKKLSFSSRIACMENQMGIVYLEGHGIASDIEKAKEHFRKGITYMYAYSYNRLAHIYEEEVQSILKEMVAKDEVSKEGIENIKISYVTAFLIFWKQIQDVGEKYGMNRLSWYLAEGILVNEERENVLNLDNMEIKKIGKDEKTGKYKYRLKLNYRWLGQYMERSPELNLFSEEQLKKFRKDLSNGKLKMWVKFWLEGAAFAGDRYAIERKRKLELGELSFD